MSTDGQGTKWRKNIPENFNRLSRVHQRYRQTTDDRQTDVPSMTYSEHELEFTFAKNGRFYIYICSFSTIFYDISISDTCLRNRKSISKPHFDKISQSTAEIKLLPV